MEHGICSECQGKAPLRKSYSAQSYGWPDHEWGEYLIDFHLFCGIPCKGEGTTPETIFEEKK